MSICRCGGNLPVLPIVSASLNRCSSFLKHVAVNVLPKALWGGELFGLPNPPIVELRKALVKFLRHGETLHRSPHGVLTLVSLAAERPCGYTTVILCEAWTCVCGTRQCLS
eukprot:1221764-Amphidinium_carterae.1